MNATENARDIEKILLQLVNSKGINITKQDSDEYEAQALFEKGLTLLENKNEQSKALKYLLKARKIKKDLPQLNFTLGKIFNKDAQYYKAYSFLKEEATLNNKLISQEYLNHLLSWTSSYLGKIDESCSYAQAAIKHREDFLPYYNDLIFFMNHSNNYSDKDINNIANQSYKNCLEKQFQIDRETIRLLLKNRPLCSSGKIKIGILSPYLQTNSAEFFIAEMLPELNQNEIEVHCFYDGDFIDTTTEKFIKYSQSFTHIQNHSALEIAKIIIGKDIDILLDTLGHIRGNRLDVFSLKPAPIQACLIGYWGSTGLPQMDYHITSKGWLGEKAHETFGEKIIEIPFFYTTPRITDIQTTEAPCLKNGFTTFGCFNRGQKISIRLLNIWSIILSLVPNSNLILSYQALSETDLQEEIWKFFEERKISNNRIKLIHRVDTRSYFELYNQIDIALDPFPFSGGCTTVDSLYMSTPLITKDSNDTAGRFSKSFLELLGATELIAKDDNDYIFKAVELANDFPQITKYKHTLKNNLINSNFFDIQTCTKYFENALKEMVKQTKENYDPHNK
jgi:predicted O-linked N-acetylglucosamine transferase (SPINDLY family)